MQAQTEVHERSPSYTHTHTHVHTVRRRHTQTHRLTHTHHPDGSWVCRAKLTGCLVTLPAAADVRLKANRRQKKDCKSTAVPGCKHKSCYRTLSRAPWGHEIGRPKRSGTSFKKPSQASSKSRKKISNSSDKCTLKFFLLGRSKSSWGTLECFTGYRNSELSCCVCVLSLS